MSLLQVWPVLAGTATYSAYWLHRPNTSTPFGAMSGIPNLVLAFPSGREQQIPLSTLWELIVSHAMGNGLPALMPGVPNMEGRLYELLHDLPVPSNRGSVDSVRFLCTGTDSIVIG